MQTFVKIKITEFEYDALIEFLGSEQIDSGLGPLYDRLVAAALADDDEGEDEEVEFEDEGEDEEDDDE